MTEKDQGKKKKAKTKWNKKNIEKLKLEETEKTENTLK